LSSVVIVDSIFITFVSLFVFLYFFIYSPHISSL